MNLDFKSGRSAAAALTVPPGPVVARSEHSPRSRNPETETILVVEDQRAIRQHLVNCLENLGYKVLASSGPTAALATLRQHKGRIDLLLTDFSMRGMSGLELWRAASTERLGIKALYMSDYPEELVWETGFLKQKPSWLAKPCTPQLLAAAVRKALGFRRHVILVLDEDEAVRTFLADALRGKGYQVLKAASLSIARGILNETRVDLMIGDLARFEQHGEESVRHLRRLHPATGILVMTGNFPAFSNNPPFVRRRSRLPMETEDLKARWFRGADATLPKPVSVDLLLETVGKLLEK